MIHLNKGEDNPHEFFSDKEFRTKYPDLWKKLNRDREHKGAGKKLKKIRTDKGITLREMMKITGISAARLCDIENGYERATDKEIQYYQGCVNI